MNAGPMLELEGITQSVPDGPNRRVILDDLQLSVAPGELVAVTGRSGSGKSTLLAIAGLLRRPEAGVVRIDGQDATALSNRAATALRRDRLALVYQSANLFPALTAIEQLEMVGHVRGEKRSVVRDRALGLLEEVGLAERAGQLPSQLSGGERQRVSVARALMANPSILLADEPTSSLDPELAADVSALIADQTRARGLATVFVTHGDAPLKWAARRLDLRGGKLVPAEADDAVLADATAS